MSIYKNGKVVTLENELIADSFCVRDGKFFEVGSEELMKCIALPHEEIIDLQGKTVVPGFIDAHMHFLNYAVTKDQVYIADATSISQLVEKTQAYIKDKKPAKDHWIISRGWNHDRFEEQRLPNRYDLDKISTDYPIFFPRVCGHIAVLNSKAIELLGITSKTQSPSGGVIDIDKDKNEPTGILRENAMNIVFDALPKISKDEMKRVLKAAFKDALSVGLTTIHSEDLGQAGSLAPLIKAYKELEEEKELPLRFALQLHLPSAEKIIHAADHGLKSGEGSDYLKIGALKLYQDGSLGGRTAAMEESYSDVESTGVIIFSQEELDELVLLAYENGFQLAIHAIGDKAMRMILESYSKIPDIKNKDLRNMIIHCQFTNEKLLDAFKELNVLANVQPSFVSTDWPIVETAVGPQRASTSYAWKDMLKKEIPVSFSSDAPIESFNPLWGIYSAVTRKDLKGNPSNSWHPDQNLSVTEALKCFTLGSAYMNFEETSKGSISNGKLADFVVLSEDILQCPKDAIKDITIEATYVSGNLVYSK